MGTVSKPLVKQGKNPSQKWKKRPPPPFETQGKRSAAATWVAAGMGHRNETKVLEQPADVFPHLMLPVRPVVTAHGTPIVEGVADSFARQHTGKPVSRAAVLPLPGSR